jgi:hypothetical protein
MYRILGADGKVYGPISADLLRQWIAENRANAATHVLPEGAPEWKPLGTLPEFSTLFAAKNPPVFSTTPTPAFAGQPPTSGFATTGLIFGILSMTFGFCCCYALPFNIPGLIFSILALVQIKSEPERYGGKGLAIAGLVLCLLSLAIAIILFTIAGVGAALSPPSSSHAYRL